MTAPDTAAEDLHENIRFAVHWACRGADADFADRSIDLVVTELRRHPRFKDYGTSELELILGDARARLQDQLREWLRELQRDIVWEVENELRGDDE
jgi:hypothetical protein